MTPDRDESTEGTAPPRTAAAHGYATHHRPLTVVHAKTLDDVRTIAHFTTKHSPPPASHRQGHSTDGQPQTFKGTVLGITTLTTINRTGGYLAPVRAGTRWSEVVSTGRPPPAGKVRSDATNTSAAS